MENMGLNLNWGPSSNYPRREFTPYLSGAITQFQGILSAQGLKNYLLVRWVHWLHLASIFLTEAHRGILEGRLGSSTHSVKQGLPGH